MGHHGWQGDPPRTEADARQRILDATLACIERGGAAKVSLSDIAGELGVTRQTVYRYYPNLTEILNALAQTGLADFVERMGAHLARCTSPVEVAVESVVFAVRAIPSEPYIGLLLQAGDDEEFTKGVLSSLGFGIGADLLRHSPADWASVGVGDEDLPGLAELLMRLFVSLLQHPGDAARDDAELRDWVRRWVALDS